MSNDVIPVTVTILGKEYKIACTENGREDLLNSAEKLDNEMREIRDSGKVSSTDRIAIVAALNLAHEFTQNKNQSLNHGISEQLSQLRQKIEAALEK